MTRHKGASNQRNNYVQPDFFHVISFLQVLYTRMVSKEEAALKGIL